MLEFFSGAKLWFSANSALISTLAVVLATVILIVGVFTTGYQFGKAVTENAQIRKDQAAAVVVELDRIKNQNLSDEIETENVSNTVLIYESFSDLSGRLANEIKDPAYSCRITPNGLQLLNAGRAAGRPGPGKHSN